MRYTRSKGTSADNSDMAASRPAAAGSGRGGEGARRAACAWHGGSPPPPAGRARGGGAARRSPHPAEGKAPLLSQQQRPGAPRLPPFWACAAGEGPRRGRRGEGRGGGGVTGRR